MESYEATRLVFSRIQSLDPEHASKIMGYILIQDRGEKEMLHLAFGPDNLLQSVIHMAKTQLGLLSNTSSTPSSPTPYNPISKPNPLSQRILNNGGLNLPSPSSPSSSPWPLSGFASDLRSPNINNHPISPVAVSSPSYAAVVNGNASSNMSSGSSLSSSSAPFSYYNNNGNVNPCGDANLMDDYQLQDHFSFLNESSLRNDDPFDPRLDMSPGPYHRRSVSLNDVCYGGADDAGSGFGWRPCMYYARGFCKNGNSCKFVHSGFPDCGDVSPGAIVGSPSKLDGFEQEMLRSRAAQQQRLAAQLMAGAPFPYNKCMNFLNDTQRSAAAALMMGEEFPKFGRCRSERNDFSGMGLGGPGSRQIYLTFPADSTFREEDVSNYFSIFGPVHDVRIPYQQKRMFGFVTFVYPETVKLILAKGNPHFVCDSRVLVKPYKEKGKVEKKQHQQQFERGDPFDPREPFDVHIGPRMFQNAQEMMLRRKLEEQADLQQAIELQGRRMMNLQLLDLKNQQLHRYQHNLSPISPISSPSQFHAQVNQGLVISVDVNNQDVLEENNSGSAGATSPNIGVEQEPQQEVNVANNEDNDSDKGNGKHDTSKLEEFELNENIEHILPDNLFASPKKSNGDQQTIFSSDTVEGNESTAISSTSSLPTTSTLNMSPLKSCFYEMPRVSYGNGAIEM